MHNFITDNLARYLEYLSFCGRFVLHPIARSLEIARAEDRLKTSAIYFSFGLLTATILSALVSGADVGDPAYFLSSMITGFAFVFVGFLSHAIAWKIWKHDGNLGTFLTTGFLTSSATVLFFSITHSIYSGVLKGFALSLYTKVQAITFDCNLGIMDRVVNANEAVASSPLYLGAVMILGVTNILFFLVYGIANFRTNLRLFPMAIWRRVAVICTVAVIFPPLYSAATLLSLGIQLSTCN